MSFEILFVLSVTIIALIVFMIDRFPIAQVSITLPVILLAGGVVSPAEATAGFSHPATITVAAMLAMSLGLEKTGVIRRVVQWGEGFRYGGWRTKLALMCLLVALLSPFLNNTAVVAVFLPVFLSMARSEGKSPSLFLMPLSFAAMLGGTITIIGTSTNLIVDSIAEREAHVGFAMFDIAPLGLACLAVGLIYILTIGLRLLPKRQAETLPEDISDSTFVMEMTVPEGHGSVGVSLSDLQWEEEHQIAVIGMRRGDDTFTRHLPKRVLVASDILNVQGEPEELLRFAEAIGLEHPADSDELVDPDIRVFEVMLGPDAHGVGSSLHSSQFRDRYEVQVLGIRQKNKLLRERLHEVRLHVGDVLLLKGDSQAFRELAEEPGNIPLGEVDTDIQGRPPWWVPTLILAGVVMVAAFGWLPILVSALAGVLIMIYTRCLRIGELYENLQWSVVFLLAGLIPMGTAFDNSGTSELLAQKAAVVLQHTSPHMSIAIVYTVTFLMTSIVSNNATAVLLTPLALESAATLGVPPERLLVTIMFGASAAFLTPMGYQTNTLVYGPGGYRFMDFVRVGLPLSVLMLLVVSFLVPLLWS